MQLAEGVSTQHRALSEIPIWLGGSQHTYVEQHSSLQKYKPEIPSHIQAQKRISSALHMHSLYLPARQDQGQQRSVCWSLLCKAGIPHRGGWAAFSSWWQNQLFPQPLRYSKGRNTICSFLPFLLSTGYNQDDLCQSILIILFMSSIVDIPCQTMDLHPA